jgi:hypothetical protein
VGASNDSTEGGNHSQCQRLLRGLAFTQVGRQPGCRSFSKSGLAMSGTHTPDRTPKGVALVDGSPYPPAQSTIGGIVSPSALASGVEGGIWRRAGAASSPRPPRNISPYRFLPDYQQGPVSGTSCSSDIHGCIRARTSAVTAPRVASERDKLVQDRPAAGDVGRSNA